MKKIMALLMAALMVFGICGCTTEPAETTEPESKIAYDGSIPAVEGFQVGFSRQDITPKESVPMSGITANSTDRMSTSVHDNLYVSCTCLTDEEGTSILLFSIDLQRPDMGIFSTVRKVLTKATGIPEDHIFFNATHTHSGPDTYNSSFPAIVTYNQLVASQTIQAAYEAIADRLPATLYTSYIDTENMNFVKHYSHELEDGQLVYFGDQYGTAVIDATTKHTTEVYNRMFVMHYIREGGKDLVAVNWRAHPHLFTSASSFKLSADFIGGFRTAVETLFDCNFSYHQGAAGNVNNSSRISSELRTKDYGEYGRIMAEYVLEAMKAEEKVTNTRIQTRQNDLELEQNHTEDHLAAQATVIRNAWKSGTSREECVKMGEPYGISSPIHAGHIVSKAKAGPSFVSEFNTVAIGDTVAFATAPHELFDSNSRWLAENSPYEFTMTFCYTNGMNGYVPSAAGWEYGCYEADCTNTVPGAGEQIQEVLLGMMEDMYNAG